MLTQMRDSRRYMNSGEYKKEKKDRATRARLSQAAGPQKLVRRRVGIMGLQANRIRTLPIAACHGWKETEC